MGIPSSEQCISGEGPRGQWTTKLLIMMLLFLSSLSGSPTLNRWTWTVASTYGKWTSLLSHVLPDPKITSFSGLHFVPHRAHRDHNLGLEVTHKFIDNPPLLPPAYGGQPRVSWQILDLVWHFCESKIEVFFFFFFIIFWEAGEAILPSSQNEDAKAASTDCVFYHRHLRNMPVWTNKRRK